MKTLWTRPAAAHKFSTAVDFHVDNRRAVYGVIEEERPVGPNIQPTRW